MASVEEVLFMVNGVMIFFIMRVVRHRLLRDCCGYPIPGSAQDEVGRGFGQPGLVEDFPSSGRGLELDDF